MLLGTERSDVASSPIMPISAAISSSDSRHHWAGVDGKVVSVIGSPGFHPPRYRIPVLPPVAGAMPAPGLAGFQSSLAVAIRSGWAGCCWKARIARATSAARARATMIPDADRIA